MTGSGLKSIDMFQRLCGEGSFRNVMLLTTKWDRSGDSAQSHEEEMINKFWAGMIKLGCSRPKRLGATVDRSLNIVDPVSDVIAPMLEFRPTWLQIQRELGKGNDLINTAAGQYVDRGLTTTITQHKETIESALTEASKTYQEQFATALAEQAGDLQREVEVAKRDKEALREGFPTVMKAEEERCSKLFGYGVLQSIDDFVLDHDLDDQKIWTYTAGLASAGLFKACKYVWKKQGASEDQIESAEASIYCIA